MLGGPGSRRLLTGITSFVFFSLHPPYPCSPCPPTVRMPPHPVSSKARARPPHHYSHAIALPPPFPF
eukprot:9474131-Pyramimonas_sp.AAC.1